MAEIHHEQRAKELGLPEGTGKRYSLQDLEALDAMLDEEGYTCFALNGRSRGPLRPLTPEEKTALFSVRTAMVRKHIDFVAENAKRFENVLNGIREANDARWVTIAFDQREEFEAFVADVFDIKRKQIGFTNTCVRNSLLLKPQLLEELGSSYNLRPVTIEDYQKTAVKIVSPYPFDTANLMRFP